MSDKGWEPHPVGLDLDDPELFVDSMYLVRNLCGEARVCLDPEPLECEDPIVVEHSFYNVQRGLMVQDGFTKKWYRLRVTAEEIADPFINKETK